MEKILVLAPHTDDGELGCGGTIAKYVQQGARVYYAAFSTCRRSLPEGWAPDTLEKEVKRATLKLGIHPNDLFIYDYDVRTFKQYRQEILEDLYKLNKQVQPTTVFVPSSSDIHQDHQAITEEGIRAFKSVKIFGYEMPWNNISFKPNAFVKLDKSHVQTKVDALMEYETQKHRNYMNSEFVFSLATVRGVQIGSEYAESFEVIRTIL